MLSDTSRRNKQNQARVDLSSKQNNSLVHSTITNLRQEISTLQQQKSMIEKQWVSQVDFLTLQLTQYKKKHSQLTDKYLIETFTKEKNGKEIVPDHQKLLRDKQILLEQEQQSKKKIEEQFKKMFEQNSRLKKQMTILRYEKEKNMEISLIQKIEFQEKNRILQQQVKSKKGIISNLKKQLEKSYSQREQLGKRERTVQQKSKQLDCFSRQVNEYNRLSEAKLNQKLNMLGKQNEFLKTYIKKLQKLAKKQCQCQLKDQRVSQNLFEIKRQLALARVKIGKQYLKGKDIQKKNKENRCSSSSSSQSVEKKYK